MTGQRVELEPSPDVQVIGDGVLIRRKAVLEAYRVLTRSIAHVEENDGYGPNKELRQMVLALKSAGLHFRAEVAEFREDVTPATLRSGRVVGVEEVAHMVGVGHRQVRNLAPSLGGWKQPSGRWAFDEGLVTAYLESKDVA